MKPCKSILNSFAEQIYYPSADINKWFAHSVDEQAERIIDNSILPISCNIQFAINDELIRLCYETVR